MTVMPGGAKTVFSSTNENCSAANWVPHPLVDQTTLEQTTQPRYCPIPTVWSTVDKSVHCTAPLRYFLQAKKLEQLWRNASACSKKILHLYLRYLPTVLASQYLSKAKYLHQRFLPCVQITFPEYNIISHFIIISTNVTSHYCFSILLKSFKMHVCEFEVSLTQPTSQQQISLATVVGSSTIVAVAFAFVFAFL